MSVKISELSTLASPPASSVLPIVLGGATRRTTITDLLGAITGGTVTSFSASSDGNLRTTPSPITTSGSLSFHLPGMIMSFAGASAPSGWVFCNGQALSRTLNAELFNVISTRYGVGDGTSTFNVPDLRGRAPYGAAFSATETNRLSGAAITPNIYTVGATGGSQTHTLTSTQVAIRSHTHSGSTEKRIYGSNYRTDSNGDCSPPGNYGDYGYVGNIATGVNSQVSNNFTHFEITQNCELPSTNPYAAPTLLIRSQLTSQTITWSQALPDITYTDSPIVLSATASSGLAVTFRVHSGPATLSGNTLRITGTGIVQLEAIQVGSAAYNPVVLARSFIVNPLPHNNIPPAIVLNYIIKV